MIKTDKMVMDVHLIVLLKLIRNAPAFLQNAMTSLSVGMAFWIDMKPATMGTQSQMTDVQVNANLNLSIFV